ncbi:hypothetical protein JIG36_15420 [Actinoplanes sp. LDG1-06]|uniref:DUF6457 domain-containing protein n=1 Tax=Paractinoplanes ovalisporus TaxID=2810368 RepID=A0ABS2AAU9_9ACTN|nr:DUF6457 domain-containing protein [Actinoplanes ovalisporus]MBM2616948.1 hypothetical protein [Actinoplanes ovalisporus]
MNELDAWVIAAAGEAGVDPADIPVKTVLDLARDVAHGVVRPGAPVTAYLLGLAAGRGADVSGLAGKLSDLALDWPSEANVGEEAAGDAGTD